MTNKTVYLAGPITGLSYEGCTDWRELVRNQLADVGIKGISPMRCKEYLLGKISIEDQYDEHILSTQRTVYARDKWDALRCDVLLVNLLGATTVSIGTVMEIAWASTQNKPIVLIMEKQNNIHEHAMLREACQFRVETIDEAVQVISSFYSQE